MPPSSASVAPGTPATAYNKHYESAPLNSTRVTYNRDVYSHPNGDPTHIDRALVEFQKDLQQKKQYMVSDTSYNTFIPDRNRVFVGKSNIPPHRLSTSSVHRIQETRALNDYD